MGGSGTGGADVLIVGGGVIGLSIGYFLAREGVRVTVLERGEVGRAASWAGAGIIAPGNRAGARSPYAQLRAQSATLYRSLSAELRQATGIDNGYRQCGGIDLALEASEEPGLKSAAGRWRAEGIEFERLGPAELDGLEPGLTREVYCGYFLPGMAQVRNPRHLKALAAGITGVGGVLRPGTTVVGFERRGDRVGGVRTLEGTLPADVVVVAAGPWSETLLAEAGVQIRTEPVRGQIALLRTRPRLLERVIQYGRQYLVPRSDGRILVGATEEHAGFDARTTATGIRGLLDVALRLAPLLAEATLERTWAGLRPGNPDGKPYLGPAPGWENLFVAAGHLRAGLQLSTGTAQLLTDLILNRPPSIPLEAFRLDRGPSEADEPPAFCS